MWTIIHPLNAQATCFVQVTDDMCFHSTLPAPIETIIHSNQLIFRPPFRKHFTLKIISIPIAVGHSIVTDTKQSTNNPYITP